MSVSAADADVGLERDVEALVGGHGGKEGLRGEVAGGFHFNHHWVYRDNRERKGPTLCKSSHPPYYFFLQIPPFWGQAVTIIEYGFSTSMRVTPEGSATCDR